MQPPKNAQQDQPQHLVPLSWFMKGENLPWLPGMDEGCAGMKCSRALLAQWNIGVVLVGGISFIYLPAPPKNVRLFVVLAVLIMKKQFCTHCDKPQAIVLKDGLDLHFRGGESTGEFKLLRHWETKKVVVMFHSTFWLWFFILSLVVIFHPDEISFLFKENFSLSQHIHLEGLSPWAAW